ncbi:MAG: TatD family deoxyribonuclease [Chlamydiae bacterium]|nr:TatD family deoxyribonuclease [Chlamydiota bacterium]
MIDTHAHLMCEQLYPDIEKIVERAKLVGVKKIFNIATDLDTLEKGISFAKRNPFIKNIAAITPHDVEKIQEDFFLKVKEAALKKELIAIGETGLDYHYFHATKENQKKSFIKHIQLALETNLPLMIHCREAFSDLIEILDEYPALKKVVIHCFTGTKKEAIELVNRGIYLSFSGILTYKKSVELQEVLEQTPIDLIILETDSPYLAPLKLRGRLNEPSFILETYEKGAELKKLEFPFFCQIIERNVKNLFSID